jgi:apolipoprotein N-acyltransferase
MTRDADPRPASDRPTAAFLSVAAGVLAFAVPIPALNVVFSLGALVYGVLGLRRSRALRSRGALGSGLVLSIVGIVLGALAGLGTLAGLVVLSQQG